MAITRETVNYVANLARMELSQAETDILAKQLHDILGFIDTLSKLDTTNISPTSHILPQQNVLRDDTPRPSLESDQALQNAPSREGNLFSVPKVIE